MTESYPTNFHSFHTRKILTAKDDIANYREVTAAQKAALEKSDAAWVQPSASLIERAGIAGAVYNEDTGFFEMNGLHLTASDMWNVLLYGSTSSPFYSWLFSSENRIRTIAHLPRNAASRANDFSGFCSGCRYIEAVNLDSITPSSLAYAFRNCLRLRVIKGVIDCHMASSFAFFADGCVLLESIQLNSLKSNIDLATLQSLSADSVQYMIDNAKNTAAITITLHSDTYARLSDELTAQAAEKQIQFVTTE